jgi:hypothetical protein
MNGDELRKALRTEMAANASPPPMSAATVLDAARRVRVRRRTLWACIGSATAVLAIGAVAAAIGVPRDGGGLNAAGARPEVIPQPLSSDTRQPMPTGSDGKPQGDQTARAGFRYDQGLKLLDAILSAAPGGYTTPQDPADLPADRLPLRSHQATFEGMAHGVEIWRYLSSAALAQGERTGRLLVEVHTVGTQMPADPCLLAQQFWGMRGECQAVTVGTAQVGVVVRPATDKRLDQWAAYRHPDGVVVYVAQAVQIFGSDRPSLPALPFTVEQLASLATDQRFHLR